MRLDAGLWKYRVMMLNPRYGFVRMARLPYMLIYELPCPVFIPLEGAVIVASAFLYVLNWSAFLSLMIIFTFHDTLNTANAFVNKLYLKEERYRFRDILCQIFVALADTLLFKPYLSAPQRVWEEVSNRRS